MSTVQRAVADIATAAGDAEKEISALLDADLKFVISAASHVLSGEFKALLAEISGEEHDSDGLPLSVVPNAAQTRLSLNELEEVRLSVPASSRNSACLEITAGEQALPGPPPSAVSNVAQNRFPLSEEGGALLQNSKGNGSPEAPAATRPELGSPGLPLTAEPNVGQGRFPVNEQRELGLHQTISDINAPAQAPVSASTDVAGGEAKSAGLPLHVVSKEGQSRFPVNEQGEVRLSQQISADINASATKPLFRAKGTKGDGFRMAPIQSAQRSRNLIAKTPGVKAPLNALSQPVSSFSAINVSKAFPGVSHEPSCVNALDGRAFNTPGGVTFPPIQTSSSGPWSEKSKELLESEKSVSTVSSQATERKASRPRIAVNKSALRSKIERVRDDPDTNTDNVSPKLSQTTPNSAAKDCLNSDPRPDSNSKPETIDSPPRDENLSSLMNLMTSVKSFLPSLRPKKNNEQSISNNARPEGPHDNFAVPDKATAAALKAKEDLRIQKQKENEEKQRRAEMKRTELAKLEKQREEDRRRKEEERARKLHDAVESKKRKQVEEERRREEKRRRVEENRKRLAEHTAPDAQQRTVSQTKTSAQPSRGPLQSSGLVARPGADTNGMRLRNQVPQAPRQVSPPASYEMTATKDAAGHSSDSDDEDRPRTKKRLPPWARSSALSDVLAKENRDPDTIFERVHTINLDEVFDGHKTKKFRPRTSSGVWVRDRLTAQEEVEYKKRTGIL